jgi:DNA invertase Pin-like site-specific DNA recombinase
MTFLDPETTPGEVRNSQVRRGQQLKIQVGRRPKKQRAGYKKKRRQKLLPYVLELREKGKSQRQIARVTGVAPSTLQEWLSK